MREARTHSGGRPTSRQPITRGGDFHWPPAGTARWPLTPAPRPRPSWSPPVRRDFRRSDLRGLGSTQPHDVSRRARREAEEPSTEAQQVPPNWLAGCASASLTVGRIMEVLNTSDSDPGCVARYPDPAEVLANLQTAARPASPETLSMCSTELQVIGPMTPFLVHVSAPPLPQYPYDNGVLSTLKKRTS